MFEMRVDVGQTVMMQGDMGDNFYVIESGTFDVLVKQRGNTPVTTIGPGDTFGEVALMWNSLRTATVKCVTAGNVWALDRGTFRHIVREANMAELNTSTQFLSSVRELAPLTDKQVAHAPRPELD